jgi:hypothetical protein
MFPKNCTSTYKPLDVVYFMQVACSNEVIYMFNNHELKFEKSKVGIIVVFTDIVIVCVLFLLIAFHKWNQDIICEDLDKDQITARDFAVEIRNLPPNNMNVNKFKAEMWYWIEKTLKENGK